MPDPTPEEKCPQCWDVGWVLDSKPNVSPTTLELIRCIYPTCTKSGAPVATLCLYGQWDRPALHPVTGAVMSVMFRPSAVGEDFPQDGPR